jgi:hypothetical protein
MGFEPTISSVTGWRALRAAPRGRDLIADGVDPDGLEPSLPGCRPGVVAARPRDFFVLNAFHKLTALDGRLYRS